MKRKCVQFCLLPLAAALSMLGACTQPVGSVSGAVMYETLKSPGIALTPQKPAWLMEAKEVHKLSRDQRRQLRQLLDDAPLDYRSERYYRAAEPELAVSQRRHLFYIYASNAQCLSARVEDGRVILDDLKLNESQQAQLYRLLAPQLLRLFPDLKPRP